MGGQAPLDSPAGDGPGPNWPSVMSSLHALPVAVLAIPANNADRANHAKSAKHIVDYLSHVFFQTCTHLH